LLGANWKVIRLEGLVIFIHCSGSHRYCAATCIS
jgi:hypothetical protein